MLTPHAVVISGSTRAGSTNSALARTAASHPPHGIRVTAFTDLAGLPHFNPDLDHEPVPSPVAQLRDLVASADVVLICTPEYAGALPGSFKNALDWLVGATVMTDRPVAWIAVAADKRRGEAAHAELATVLGYVQARVLRQACVQVPLAGTAVGPDGLVRDPSALTSISAAVAQAVSVAKESGPSA